MSRQGEQTREWSDRWKPRQNLPTQQQAAPHVSVQNNNPFSGPPFPGPPFPGPSTVYFDADTSTCRSSVGSTHMSQPRWNNNNLSQNPFFQPTRHAPWPPMQDSIPPPPPRTMHLPPPPPPPPRCSNDDNMEESDEDLYAGVPPIKSPATTFDVAAVPESKTSTPPLRYTSAGVCEATAIVVDDFSPTKQPVQQQPIVKSISLVQDADEADALKLEPMIVQKSNAVRDAEALKLDSTIAEKSSPERDAEALKLEIVKEKFRKAQERLLQAKKRKREYSPTTPMKLHIVNICGPDEMVRLLPNPVFVQGPCPILPAMSDSEEEDSSDEEEDSERTKKQLELRLKKKKLELLLLKQQRQQQQEEEPVKPPRLSKQELMKRQEELQQTMDDAQWKQVVLKQRNLFTQEKRRVEQDSVKLQECRIQIAINKQVVGELEEGIQESIARDGVLQQEIDRVFARVMEARGKLREARTTQDDSNA